MTSQTFQLERGNGVGLFVRAWLPAAAPKAVVQIAHGMAEHSARYARLASALNAAGFAVYASDHRGHGHTATAPDQLGDFGVEGGFDVAVRDMRALTDHLTRLHPGVPLFLLGHSLGSMMLQRYLYVCGEGISGAIMSGTNAGPLASILARPGLVAAKAERWRKGPTGRSPLMQFLTFGSYNHAFRPVRTEFDWLSRDAAEVDAYIADPLCGFPMALRGWIDILQGVIENGRESNIAQVAKDLPVYSFCGALDPVGNQTRGPKALVAAYRAAGMTDISERYYASGRHEMFNEINRDEVTSDLIAWLDGVLARRGAGDRAGSRAAGTGTNPQAVAGK